MTKRCAAALCHLLVQVWGMEAVALQPSLCTFHAHPPPQLQSHDEGSCWLPAVLRPAIMLTHCECLWDAVFLWAGALEQKMACEQTCCWALFRACLGWRRYCLHQCLRPAHPASLLSALLLAFWCTHWQGCGSQAVLCVRCW